MRFGRKIHATRVRLGILAAVLALFGQALLPAAAMAAESLVSFQIELCTDQGAKTVVIGADGEVQKGFAGLPCHDCLGATIAAIASPELAVAPVSYVHVEVRHATPTAPLRPRARAPPRPPGQGPPPLNA